MANIFKLANDAVKAYRTGKGISKKEASSIMVEGGWLEDEDEIDDYVFDAPQFFEPVTEMELWDGYTVGEYAQDFEKVYIAAVSYGVGNAISESLSDTAVEALDGIAENLSVSDVSSVQAPQNTVSVSSGNKRVGSWLLVFVLPFVFLIL